MTGKTKKLGFPMENEFKPDKKTFSLEVKLSIFNIQRYMRYPT